MKIDKNKRNPKQDKEIERELESSADQTNELYAETGRPDDEHRPIGKDGGGFESWGSEFGAEKAKEKESRSRTPEQDNSTSDSGEKGNEKDGRIKSR